MLWFDHYTLYIHIKIPLCVPQINTIIMHRLKTKDKKSWPFVLEAFTFLFSLLAVDLSPYLSFFSALNCLCFPKQGLPFSSLLNLIRSIQCTLKISTVWKTFKILFSSQLLQGSFKDSHIYHSSPPPKKIIFPEKKI